jgi:hypothetical protein
LVISAVHPKPKPDHELTGLTFASSTPEQRAATRASWNHWDVIHTAIVLSVESFGRRGAPSERAVSVDENPGRFAGIEAAEAPDDGAAGIALIVAGDLGGFERGGDGDGAAAVIGLSGAVAGDFAAGLRPGRGVGRVRVDDAAGAEGAVDLQMRRQIGRRAEAAFDDAAVQVRDHHLFGRQLFKWDAARLDDDQALLEPQAARVAEGVKHEAAANEFAVGLENLASQFIQSHEKAIV